MKSIVVPVNFSPCSANAAQYAADLALALHADLHLIHVAEVPVTSAELTMTEELYQELVDSADQSLQELRAGLTKRTGGRIKVTSVLEAGSTVAKVNELCQRLQAYAVVVGTTGPTAEKFLTGSPVTSLLGNIPYPVLVVPENDHFNPFRRVVLACDYEDIGNGITQALPLLRDIRLSFGTLFDVITVDTRKPKDKEQFVFECDTWYSQMKELCPEHHFVHAATVEDGLLQYLEGTNVDLVLVFPKKHGILEFHVSQSKKLAKHSPIPVLSVHK